MAGASPSEAPQGRASKLWWPGDGDTAFQAIAALWLLFALFNATGLGHLIGFAPSSRYLLTVTLAFALALSLGFLNPLQWPERWRWLNAPLAGFAAFAVLSRAFWGRPDIGDLSGIAPWGLVLGAMALALLVLAIWRSLGWLFGLAAVLALAIQLAETAQDLASFIETGLGIALSSLWFSAEGIFGVWFGSFEAFLIPFMVAGLFFGLPRTESLLQTIFFGPLARLTGRPVADLVPSVLAGSLSLWLFGFFGLASVSHLILKSASPHLAISLIEAVWAFFLWQAAHFASFAVQRRFRFGGWRRPLFIWCALTTLSLGLLLYIGARTLGLGDALVLWLVLAASWLASPRGNFLALVHNMVSLLVVYFGANLIWFASLAVFLALKEVGATPSADVLFWWFTAAALGLLVLLSVLFEFLRRHGRPSALVELGMYLMPLLVLFWMMATGRYSPGISSMVTALVALGLWLCVTFGEGARAEQPIIQVLGDRLGERLAVAGRLLTLTTLGIALLGLVLTVLPVDRL